MSARAGVLLLALAAAVGRADRGPFLFDRTARSRPRTWAPRARSWRRRISWSGAGALPARCPRQFTVAIALTVALITAGLGVVALLMLLEPRPADHRPPAGLRRRLDLVRDGGLVTGVLDDIESLRDGLQAVGEGDRDVRIATRGRDELAGWPRRPTKWRGQLAEREARRDSAEAARRDLVAAVSHDLRTRLILRLLADAVDDDLVDSDTRRRYLEQMSVHIHSLSALIEDLFELSRLEAGEIQWSMQQVHLGELVEEAVEAMKPAADARRVAVRASLNGELDPAQANPEKLSVLFNLIQNAIRHTPADGSVTVAAESNGRTVEVEVADTGEGIAAEDRARVFEPFFRAGLGAARTAEDRAGPHDLPRDRRARRQDLAR